MFDGDFAFALTAGMVATVNPCGFALLPAYLSVFVGLDDRQSRASAVGRALSVSAVMTAGFIAVFGLFGAVVNELFGGIQQQLPWLTVAIGVVLLGLAGYLLTGRQLTLNIPKFQRGGSDGTLLSMFLFGVSYAIASLSCTVGPFLAVTTRTFDDQSFIDGLAVFVTYGLGMGVVVGILTLAVALAKDGIVQKFRSLLPKMNRIAGALLLIAGLYVVYYGIYEIRVFEYGADPEDPIIDRAIEIQGWLQNQLPTTDEAPWWALGAGVVMLAALLWARFRRSGGEPEPAPDAPDTPESAEAVAGS
jgi:cytochrome c biogenesis protein CcdA